MLGPEFQDDPNSEEGLYAEGAFTPAVLQRMENKEIKDKLQAVQNKVIAQSTQIDTLIQGQREQKKAINDLALKGICPVGIETMKEVFMEIIDMTRPSPPPPSPQPVSPPLQQPVPTETADLNQMIVPTVHETYIWSHEGTTQPTMSYLPKDFKFPKGARPIFDLFKVGNCRKGICPLSQLSRSGGHHFRISGERAKYKKCKLIVEFMDKALEGSEDGKIKKAVFERTKTFGALAAYFTAAQEQMLRYMPAKKIRNIDRANIELTTVYSSLQSMKKKLNDGTPTVVQAPRRTQEL